MDSLAIGSRENTVVFPWSELLLFPKGPKRKRPPSNLFQTSLRSEQDRNRFLLEVIDEKFPVLLPSLAELGGGDPPLQSRCRVRDRHRENVPLNL